MMFAEEGFVPESLRSWVDVLLLMLDDGSGWELCKPAAAKLAGVPGTTAGRLREALPPRDGKHKACQAKTVQGSHLLSQGIFI